MSSFKRCVDIQYSWNKGQMLKEWRQFLISRTIITQIIQNEPETNKKEIEIANNISLVQFMKTM